MYTVQYNMPCRTDGQGNHLSGGGDYGFCGQSCPGDNGGGGLIKTRITSPRDGDGIVFGDDSSPGPS